MGTLPHIAPDTKPDPRKFFDAILHREKWICCSNKFGTVDMPIVNRTTVFVESSDGIVEAKKPTSLGRQSKTVKVGLLLL